MGVGNFNLNSWCWSWTSGSLTPFCERVPAFYGALLLNYQGLTLVLFAYDICQPKVTFTLTKEKSMKNIKVMAEQIAVIYPYWIFTKYLLYIKVKHFLHACWNILTFWPCYFVLSFFYTFYKINWDQINLLCSCISDAICLGIALDKGLERGVSYFCLWMSNLCISSLSWARFGEVLILYFHFALN